MTFRPISLGKKHQRERELTGGSVCPILSALGTYKEDTCVHPVDSKPQCV